MVDLFDIGVPWLRVSLSRWIEAWKIRVEILNNEARQTDVFLV